MPGMSEAQREGLGKAVVMGSAVLPAALHWQMLRIVELPVELFFIIAALGGLIGGTLAATHPRLKILAAIIGGAAASSGMSALFVAGGHLRSISWILAMIIAAVGAAPVLIIGGLAYSMAYDRLTR